MVQVIQGTLPAWALSGYGDGYGCGYGSSGYGDGSGDGSGYGSSGYGDGSGYGSSGSGCGYGSSGYGYGCGSGSGYGSSGYGDGSGYGSYGYGDGSGYGSGDGSGYGYGDGLYWRACLASFVARTAAEQRARATDLAAAGATLAYWRSDGDGRACNGGRNDPVQPGTVETAPGPLQLCGRGTLHATLIPPMWSGARWWIVALTGEIVGDDEKLGALQREIIGECQ